jgi:hypothetical protein
MTQRVLIAAAIALIAAAPAPLPQDSAFTLFANGDFGAAATSFQTYLQRHPGDSAAKIDLAAIRLYENDLSGAEALLDPLVSVGAQSDRVARLLAEVMRRRAEAARRTTIDGAEARVAFVTDDPLPVVRVVANGTPANFIVDTGADVDLEPSFAARIGVKTTSSGNGVFAGGRRAPMASGMLASLSLGAATAYDVPAHVIVTHASELFPKIHIDGIVGTTYFERFLVTIDFPNHQLLLQPRSPAVSSAFQAAAAAAHATIVPCYLVGDHFVMARAQVNAAAPGLFLFDSGLAGGGLMPSPQLLSAARIPIDQSLSGTGYGGGGAITTLPFVARRVAVGDAVQQDVPGLYTPQGSPLSIFPFLVWGAISNDFLKHYAYTVDFDAMTIVLRAPENTSSANLSPTQRIFDDAFRRWQTYPVPAYAVWTLTWQIRQTPMGFYTGSATSTEVHRYALRLADGMENVSDPIGSGKLPPAIIEPEFLGPFAWTTRASVRVAPAGGGNVMTPDVAGLETIARVVAVEQPSYAIAGAPAMPPIEILDGRSAYHLRLEPRRDPQKHNLRDLWIDAHTYDVLKAHFVGTYAPVPGAPLSPTDVTVSFRSVLGCWVVTHADWTYQNPPTLFDFDVTSNELGLPATLPDWLFDAAQYERHRRAGDPDYVGVVLDRLRSGGG